jgi:enoyl-CoA hydratase/carnithine racemase
MVSAAEAIGLGLVTAVAPADVPFDGFITSWLDSWSHQRPQVLRAFKAQALAERLGAPRSEREAAELSGFVAAWLHEDHWHAAEKAIAGMGGGSRKTS